MYPPFFGSPVRASGPVGIDTDERRKVLRNLTDALYEYLALPITEMERAYLAQAATSRVSMDAIMHIQEEIEIRRGRLEEARVKIDATLETIPEEMQGMFRVQLESMSLEPLAQEIAGMERYLTQMQAEYEKGIEGAAPHVERAV